MREANLRASTSSPAEAARWLSKEIDNKR